MPGDAKQLKKPYGSHMLVYLTELDVKENLAFDYYSHLYSVENFLLP